MPLLDRTSAVDQTGGRRRGLFAWVAVGSLLLLSTACDRSENQRAKADVSDAAQQAGVGLNRAAADTKDTVDDLAANAKPAADKAARDAKRALDKLAVDTGRATKKAGQALEQAGERGRRDSGQTPSQ